MDQETFERNLRLLGTEYELGGEGLERYVQNNIDYVVEQSDGEWDEHVAEKRIKYLEGD